MIRVNIYNKMYKVLVFADDIDIVACWCSDLKKNVMQLTEVQKNMDLTVDENKYMVMAHQRVYTDDFTADLHTFEKTDKLIYLVSLICVNTDIGPEIKRCIILANKVFYEYVIWYIEDWYDRWSCNMNIDLG